MIFKKSDGDKIFCTNPAEWWIFFVVSGIILKRSLFVGCFPFDLLPIIHQPSTTSYIILVDTID